MGPGRAQARAPSATRGRRSHASTVRRMLMKHRLVHDFAAVLVAHGLFERFPRLKVAYIENGGDVGRRRCSTASQVLHGQNPGMFKTNPVDQFIEHCWVAPFVEDSVARAGRGTCRSSGSCSAPTGRTPKASRTRETSSTTSRSSRSTTSAGSWSRTPGR